MYDNSKRLPDVNTLSGSLLDMFYGSSSETSDHKLFQQSPVQEREEHGDDTSGPVVMKASEASEGMSSLLFKRISRQPCCDS